jgi:hypothetical protein
VESVARFESDKLKEIVATFYARGDAGSISKEKFDALVRSAAEALNNFTKVKFTVRGKDATNAVRPEGVIWETPAARYLLEYSFVKPMKSRNIEFRAEFVRLEITPAEKPAGLLATALSATKPKFSAADRVKRDAATGDVVLTDVPMVDQGQKGYCAVACAERVLRYYGVQVDANEVAQIANSDASSGTSADAMFDALRKIGARLRVRVKPIEQVNVKDILALIADYNRAAKKANAPLIPDPGNMIDVGAIYRAMRPDVLKEVRTKSKADLGKFQRTVQSNIDGGTPLLWSVVLGFVPEKPELPQAFGGHMRVIIGYNSKTQEILYSDSWGRGHELKRMKADDAWTITTTITTIEPFS